MNFAKEILNDIIQEGGIFFRGIELGSPIDALDEIEGDDFDETSGSLSYREYYFETGEMEEVFVYYGFDEADRKVNYIKLFLYAYPKIYWKDDGGENEQDFVQLFHDQNLGKYSKHFDRAKKMLVSHFTDLFGLPETVMKNKQFNQPCHEFIKHIWKVKNQFELSLTAYNDDSSDGSLKQTLIMHLANQTN